MNIHKNARLTPIRREEMALCVIEDRLSNAQAGRTYGVSAKIVARWVGRYRVHGRAGMVDREVVVDIKHIAETRSINRTDGGWCIGAAVAGAELSEHAEFVQAWPGVAEATDLIGTPSVGSVVLALYNRMQSLGASWVAVPLC